MAADLRETVAAREARIAAAEADLDRAAAEAARLEAARREAEERIAFLTIRWEAAEAAMRSLAQERDAAEAAARDLKDQLDATRAAQGAESIRSGSASALSRWLGRKAGRPSSGRSAR